MQKVKNCNILSVIKLRPKKEGLQLIQLKSKILKTSVGYKMKKIRNCNFLSVIKFGRKIEN